MNHISMNSTLRQADRGMSGPLPGAARETNGPLSPIGIVMQLNPKDTLLWEGDPVDDIFQIVRGVVCLYKLLPDGRRQVARFCHPGDIIGLTAEDRYPYTADALTALSVVRVSRAEVDARIDTEPAFRSTILAAVGEELALAQRQLLLLGRKSASERVATFLQAMSEQAVRAGGDGATVELAMTRVDIADYLGLTHETVCRIIGQFKNQGVIATPDPHRVEILLPAVLRDVAAGGAPEKICA